MINFILMIIAVIVGIEIRELIYKFFRNYKFSVTKNTVDNEMIDDLKRSDLL